MITAWLQETERIKMKRTNEKILKAVLDTYAYSNIKTFPVDLELIVKSIGYTIRTYDEYSCGE